MWLHFVGTMISTCEFRFQDVLSVMQPFVSVEKDFLYHTSPNSLQVDDAFSFSSKLFCA